MDWARWRGDLDMLTFVIMIVWWIACLTGCALCGYIAFFMEGE